MAHMGGAGGKTKIGAGRFLVAASILKIFKFSKYNIIYRNSRFIDSSAILGQYLYKFKNIDIFKKS
jgi:hypothetical protein